MGGLGPVSPDGDGFELKIFIAFQESVPHAPHVGRCELSGPDDEGSELESGRATDNGDRFRGSVNG